jgi:hypothetical protein
MIARNSINKNGLMSAFFNVLQHQILTVLLREYGKANLFWRT